MGFSDSDEIYLEGEASRFRWLRAPATTEDASSLAGSLPLAHAAR